MTTPQISDALKTDESLMAPAGLNLLGEEDTGGCCGGGSCSVPAGD